MSGSVDASVIVCTPAPGTLNAIVSGPGAAFALVIAWRRLPAPASLVLTTVNVAAWVQHPAARSRKPRAARVRARQPEGRGTRVAERPQRAMGTSGDASAGRWCKPGKPFGQPSPCFRQTDRSARLAT